jgi:hypothetical protein
MLLKDYVGSSWVDHWWFVRIHLAIQIYLVLTGIGCCLVSSHLTTRTETDIFSGCNLTLLSANLSISSSSTSYVKTEGGGGGWFHLSAVALMVFGVIQTAPSLLCVSIHILYGYIARTGFILVHVVGTVVQIISGCVALITTGLIIPEINSSSCSQSHNLGLVRGLPVLMVFLVFSVLLHIVVIVLLLTVDFISIMKDSCPPKIRLDSYRSPAMYMSRVELEEIKDSADLMKLHQVLRTRLPSLKSNHPTQPPSPGFLSSLADVPLSPYLKDPTLTLDPEGTRSSLHPARY